MWLKIHKQSEKERYSHRKRTKATMVEGTINHITTKIELRILAAMDSYFGLFRPPRLGTYRLTPEQFDSKAGTTAREIET